MAPFLHQFSNPNTGAIVHTPSLTLTPADRSNTQILFPRSAVEAVAMAKEHKAPYIAGATALQLGWNKNTQWPAVAVALGGLSELTGTQRLTDSWQLSALTSMTQLINNKALAEELPLLRQAALGVGAAGVRQLATLAGNIGFAGDLLPSLLVLDAQVLWLGVDGEQLQSLASWLISPPPYGLIIAVRIPIPAALSITRMEKLLSRSAFNPPLLNLASYQRWQDQQLQSLQVAIGGAAISPCLLPVTATQVQATNGITELTRLLRDALGKALGADCPQRDYLISAGANLLCAQLREQLP